MTPLQACDKAGVRYRRALAERDQTILEAAEAGESLRNIAIAVGLSHMGVKKIIDRQ